MLSIGLTLFSWKKQLPSGWDASKGLRTLFPTGYKGSISPLKQYVYFHYSLITYDPDVSWVRHADGSVSQVNSPNFCNATCWLFAAGSGQWFFGWQYGNNQFNGVTYQAGFRFTTQIANAFRGYVDSTNPQVLTTSASAGSDSAISQNWPTLFTKGSTIFFQSWLNPNPASVWDGKANIDCSSTPLSGGAVTAQGTGSGSALFPFPGATADSYVAAIVASAVAKNLKAGKTTTVDSDTVRQIVSSSSFRSPAKQSILDFLQLPVSKQLISDATVLATQVFNYNKGTGTPPAAGVLAGVSGLVTQSQIISALNSAYSALGIAGQIPGTLWAYAKAYNTNPTVAAVLDEVEKLYNSTQGDLPFLWPYDIAVQAILDLVAWVAGAISDLISPSAGASPPAPDPTPEDPSTSPPPDPGSSPPAGASASTDTQTGDAADPEDPGDSDPSDNDPGGAELASGGSSTDDPSSGSGEEEGG